MARNLSRKTVRMVVVENDDDDLFLLKRAFEQAGFTRPFVHLEDGTKAIDYFQRLEHPTSGLPDIVLMDIKMPGKDGFQVLEWLRGNPLCKDLPVILLTSSSEPSDIRKSKRFGVYRFVTKEVHYAHAISALKGFLAGQQSDEGSA